ncbi:Rieske (2Fe-2S) protein [Candidatus Persebacteraceae bacterium Df01]|jgi:nitrite reductase/ring-hydroxylating ferredoxin subunit|uniref:Rieske (2Fe-2S) protein n=1 Tax=Candidatus Doriopsillibacter californiensis TaxID=2970740 RepID=A0ABT7QLW4_9GAMM|nr:Rieske (2Fe-2S) protein [Candidatus Persebacteraceae bacterium Df01]
MAKKHFVCETIALLPGERRLLDVGSRSIGVFNVDGSYYALLNVCPHTGGNLCEGPVCGTNLPVDDYRYEYGMENKVLRCAWHGWEFDITTGACLIEASKLRAKTYPVEVENEQVFVLV